MLRQRADASKREVKRVRDEKRREVGERNLKMFGFNIGSERTGISQHSNGSGGDGSSVEIGSEFIPDPRCTPEQLEVLDKVEAEENVFFTGPAGSSSRVITMICWLMLCPQVLERASSSASALAALLSCNRDADERLAARVRRKLDYLRRRFQVTAPTGNAALLVSGNTLHSWAGLGLAKDNLGLLFDTISQGCVGFEAQSARGKEKK